MKTLLCTVAALALCAGAAGADTLKMFSGGAGYTGPFSGAGTVYSGIVASGVAQTCANNGPCVELISTPQIYGLLQDGLTATAGSLNVWDDTSPNFGGIGVGSGPLMGTDTNDNIDGSNVLTLTFNQSVELAGVATLFDPGHAPFGNGNPLTSSFLLNGHEVSFVAANTELLGALSFTTGTTFTFAEDGTTNPSFYVSGLTFLPGAIAPGVPEPATWAMMLLGFISLAFAFRQRRRIARFA